MILILLLYLCSPVPHAKYMHILFSCEQDVCVCTGIELNVHLATQLGCYNSSNPIIPHPPLLFQIQLINCYIQGPTPSGKI